MIYLTKAVFINSCQTFIFFPSSQAYGIDPGLFHLSSVFCVGQGHRGVRRRFCYWCVIHRPVYPRPTYPRPWHFFNKKSTKTKTLTSMDTSDWCAVSTGNLACSSCRAISSAYSVSSQSDSNVASNHCEESQLKRRREGPFCTGVSVLPCTSASLQYAHVLQLAGEATCGHLRGHTWCPGCLRSSRITMATFFLRLESQV